MWQSTTVMIAVSDEAICSLKTTNASNASNHATPTVTVFSDCNVICDDKAYAGKNKFDDQQIEVHIYSFQIKEK